MLQQLRVLDPSVLLLVQLLVCACPLLWVAFLAVLGSFLFFDVSFLSAGVLELEQVSASV